MKKVVSSFKKLKPAERSLVMKAIDSNIYVNMEPIVHNGWSLVCFFNGSRDNVSIVTKDKDGRIQSNVGDTINGIKQMRTERVPFPKCMRDC